jgi:hypothetical protein
MSMKNIAPVVSTLDNLLRQSLSALACSQTLDSEIRVRFDAAFERIARFYRATDEIVCQRIIKPGGTTIEIDRHPLRCPRLLVQCTQPDASAARALPFVYVPDQADRIALDILHGDARYRSSQFFQWIPSKGWCNADGSALSEEIHTVAVSKALFEPDLFNVTTMTLVPLSANSGADQ